ncbi:MAG: ABC transporter permease [Deltaproteobacteria bacterium]|jgi:NitT/TauT family transport system permease protein|nr:ABC transporter permease [Deltaproteobacteria bacterium]
MAREFGQLAPGGAGAPGPAGALGATEGMQSPGLEEREAGAFNRRVMGWYGIIAFLALWQVGPWLGLFDGRFIPPFSDVLHDAWVLVRTGEFFIHVATSTQRALLGLVGAILVGVPAGVCLAGFFPRATRFLNPLLSLLGNINPFALFPLFILLFGVGEVAKFAIIFWSAVFPVLNFTIYGVGSVDPVLVKAARSMGADRTQIFWKVILPASVPSIFTGFKMGATVAFLFLIAAEMLSATAGMGYMVHNASMNNYIPRIYVGVLGIALLGMGMTVLINRLERTLLSYKEEARAS